MGDTRLPLSLRRREDREAILEDIAPYRGTTIEERSSVLSAPCGLAAEQVAARPDGWRVLERTLAARARGASIPPAERPSSGCCSTPFPVRGRSPAASASPTDLLGTGWCDREPRGSSPSWSRHERISTGGGLRGEPGRTRTHRGKSGNPPAGVEARRTPVRAKLGRTRKTIPAEKRQSRAGTNRAVLPGAKMVIAARGGVRRLRHDGPSSPSWPPSRRPHGPWPVDPFIESRFPDCSCAFRGRAKDKAQNVPADETLEPGECPAPHVGGRHGRCSTSPPGGTCHDERGRQ